jgi:hypothetical protein
MAVASVRRGPLTVEPIRAQSAAAAARAARRSSSVDPVTRCAAPLSPMICSGKSAWFLLWRRGVATFNFKLRAPGVCDSPHTPYLILHIEPEMVAARKPAKRKTAKKRAAVKAQPGKKKGGPKRSSKRGARKTTKATQLRRKARKGLKAARGGLDTVLHAGQKTWKSLKSRTARVLEGVKDS